MKYRDFGKTGLKVSEVGFGAWAIGGAYGAVNKAESLNALARAEELGCNFIDTAAVYGDSEAVLGEFLKGRRDKWLLATKYSGQPEGMEKTLDAQLRRLGTDYVDLYQIHWAPHESQPYRQLEALRAAGKTRFIGVSLYNANDIDFVLDHTDIDSIQLAFSLLDPFPYLQRLNRIRDSNIAVIVRSCLKEGFLTGKFKRGVRFDDPADQRREWSTKKINDTLDLVEAFRFLERDNQSLMLAAARYPLNFQQTSTLILGTKTLEQANLNFEAVPQAGLSNDAMTKIEEVQRRLKLGQEPGLLHRLIKKIANRVTSI